MKPAAGEVVKDKNGLTGTVESSSLFDEGQDRVLLKFDGNRRVAIPEDMLIREESGGYHLPLRFDELEPVQQGASSHEDVIPVIREEAQVRKRTIETGRVRISKHVHEREEQVDIPLTREEVEIKRVPIDRVVDGPVPVRREGDVTIVPLLEEVLVVEKKLVLKEEVHIGTKRTERHEPQRVTLRSEEVTVEREDGREDSVM